MTVEAKCSPYAKRAYARNIIISILRISIKNIYTIELMFTSQDPDNPIVYKLD